MMSIHELDQLKDLTYHRKILDWAKLDRPGDFLLGYEKKFEGLLVKYNVLPFQYREGNTTVNELLELEAHLSLIVLFFGQDLIIFGTSLAENSIVSVRNNDIHGYQ